MNVQNIQKNAAEVALGVSLPTRRVESFHYTDLRSQLGTFDAKAERPSEDEAKKLGDGFPRLASNAAVLHFYDGHAFERNEALPEGISVNKTLPSHLTVNSLDDTIAAINNELSADGVSITVADTANVERPIGLAHAFTGKAATTASTRFSIEAGKGSTSTFIERFMGTSKEAHLSSSVVSLKLGEGATLNYMVVQQSGLGADHLGHIAVELAADAKLNLFILNAGGRLVRQEVRVNVAGEGAHVDIKGVNLVGNNAHIDVTTVLDHNVPNTTANELFRNVVAGDGHGVFQGQIKVAQIAQKTDAQMACNTLLLTDEGDFSAKPELEIFADDVLCAHGATVTDIDDDHLFYLRARGIKEKAARGLLIKAFVDEVVEELGVSEELEEAFIGIIDNWLDANT